MPSPAFTALTADARGVFPIAPTPFFDDGTIDIASIDRLTDFYLACGATGITVLGQLGERLSWSTRNPWRWPRR